jgi:hypothetical protein
MSNL